VGRYTQHGREVVYTQHGREVVYTQHDLRVVYTQHDLRVLHTQLCTGVTYPAVHGCYIPRVGRVGYTQGGQGGIYPGGREGYSLFYEVYEV